MQQRFAGYEPARVCAELRGSHTLITAGGELAAKVSGRFLHHADPGAFPAVGDWVAITARSSEGSATIHGVLERRTKLSRQVAGKTTEEQILAANVDIVFVVAALNEEFNLRRIERYLTSVWQSGAVPVVVLNKADLCDDLSAALDQTVDIAPGADVLVTTAVGGDVSPLTPFIGPGQTCAFVGSSGVGKSSLINALVGAEAMTVRDIRFDGKGRHTTTRRQLIPLTAGGVVIDTPGMREFQLWEADDGFDRAFADISELAESCRFSDCSHTHEPGCAVKEALANGSLDEARWRSYAKQQAELAAVARRKDRRLASENARRWKLLTKDAKARSRPWS